MGLAVAIEPKMKNSAKLPLANRSMALLFVIFVNKINSLQEPRQSAPVLVSGCQPYGAFATSTERLCIQTRACGVPLLAKIINPKENAAIRIPKAS